MADPVHGLNLSSDDNSKKSRKGSIPRNVETYLKTASMNAFADEVSKLAEGQERHPARDMAQMALLAGGAAPVIDLSGRFVRGLIDTPGDLRARLSGGSAEVGKATAGDLAAKAFTAGVGGTALGYAKNRLQQYQQGLDGKVAAALAGGAPTGPRIAVAAGPASSAKGMRIGNTPIAAKSGVTRPGAAKPVNPRMPLSDAMTPKV